MAVKRMWLTSEESKVEALTATAERYGMPASVFAGLCAWMGYKVLMRTIEPEAVFSPEQLVDMYKHAKDKGLDVQDPSEVERMLEDAKST
jgi:hypothetical protein